MTYGVPWWSTRVYNSGVYTGVCLLYTLGGVYTGVCLPIPPWVCTILHHPGIYSPYTPWVHPTIPTYPVVYRVLHSVHPVSLDEALGSRVVKPLGGKALEPLRTLDVLRLVGTSAQSSPALPVLNVRKIG